jgi:ribonuclease HII
MKPIKLKPHDKLKAYDDDIRLQYGSLLMGVDDAGRGAFAGPLAIGCVILPEDCEIVGLNDSKKLNEETRLKLAETIKNIAIAWSVQFVHAKEIDEKGITWANTQATKKACIECFGKIHKPTVDIFVADNTIYFPYKPAIVIPKGDATSLSVAAASVLAKTVRDLYMVELSEQYPHYGWAENKGYVNEYHKNSVIKHGMVEGIHRKSYKITGVNKPHQITLSDM